MITPRKIRFDPISWVTALQESIFLPSNISVQWFFSWNHCGIQQPKCHTQWYPPMVIAKPHIQYATLFITIGQNIFSRFQKSLREIVAIVSLSWESHLCNFTPCFTCLNANLSKIVYRFLIFAFLWKCKQRIEIDVNLRPKIRCHRIMSFFVKKSGNFVDFKMIWVLIQRKVNHIHWT